MSDFVRSQDHPHRDLLAWCDGWRGLDPHFHYRTLRPLGTNLRDIDVALQPVGRQLHVLFGAIQMQQRRHKVIRRQKAVTAVVVIVGAPVIVRGVSRSRVSGIDQWHVALTALDRRTWVALVVPMASRPVVILVLQLDPADPIHFLVDELLVARGAVLRFLVHALAQAIVLRRPRADEEIASYRPDGVLRTPLPEIFGGLRKGVVRIALYVGLLNGMTGYAGNTFLVALQTC